MATDRTPKHDQPALLIAGVPAENRAVLHRLRLDAHDPAIFIRLHDGTTVGICRDVELPRLKSAGRVDRAHIYQDFAPEQGLSPDRPVAAAQAAAECLRRNGVSRVVSDRTLPLLFVHELGHADIGVICDPMLGIAERRMKDAQEVEHLQRVQKITEDAIRMACEHIANAKVLKSGELEDPDTQGQPLTSERVKGLITSFLAERQCIGEHFIVAGGADGEDCHAGGTGPLHTGEPIIVDVFPKDTTTGYHGDCTRGVVHGQIPPEVAKMHEAVRRAKAASIAATKAGVTGEAVHLAGVAEIEKAGYPMGFPPADAPTGFCSMPHGTGHGLGLDLKEPPLIDMGAPKLLIGDAVTIEPGLYALGLGGVRLEDLVIVTADGCTNLNTLHDGLSWS